MQESYGKGPASHPDPESCGSGRKTSAEALTGAHAGQPSNCEIRPSGVPTLLREAEGNTDDGVTGEPLPDPAQSETLSMRGTSSHGNREIPAPSAGGAADRSGKGSPRKPDAHDAGKSDGRIVPRKPPNNDGPPTSAEAAEGRRPT